MQFERLSSLTIGVSGFNERVDGTTVKTTDWTDVAQALGQCTKEQADLLRAIYLHDTPAARRVVERLARRTCRIEHAGLLSRDLAFSTLRAFSAMRPCEHCEGKGRVKMPDGMRLNIETGEWTPYKGGWKECSWCRGDGYTHVKPAEVQKLMHVSDQVWELLLARPFADAYEQLRKWHKDGEATISAA
jgi:hypothetical protein